MYNKKSVLPLIITTLIFIPSESAEKVLILDTGNNDPHAYRNAMLFIKSAELTPEFKQWYEMDTDTIATYKKILLIIDDALIAATANPIEEKESPENPILKHIYSLIDALNKQKNIAIGIAVPVPQKNSIERLAATKKILNRLGVIDLDLNNETLDHLLQSDSKKSTGYNTALLYKRAQQKTALEPLYPLSFFIKKPITGNTFFITNISYLTFADIAENFVLNPTKSTLRNQLLEAMRHNTHEFYAPHQSPDANIILPELFTDAWIQHKKSIVQQQRAKQIKPSYQWIEKEGIMSGWMHLDPFFQKEELVAEHILKSGLNMLWLELRPEWYLSDNATNSEEQKTKFFDSIKQLTAALQKKSKQLNINVPRIFIGMEISGNFGQKKVHEAAVDMYGKTYPHIPSPLDFDHYWKKEVIEVFERFHQKWLDSLGNGLPIAGIVLDFEMYHAQHELSQYNNLFDFSDLSWNLYAHATKNPKLVGITCHNERIAYLLREKQFEHYFSILTNQAQTIGKQIKDHFQKILPNGIIAAYCINIPNEWFYKGIMAGLSSPDSPLILATFNNDFYSHYDWLVSNNIYLYHVAILLFSKLNHEKKFHLIEDLFHNHDGIWLNRYSRLEEPKKPGPWDCNVETTPLETNTVIKLLHDHIINVRQQLIKKS